MMRSTTRLMRPARATALLGLTLAIAGFTAIDRAAAAPDDGADRGVAVQPAVLDTAVAPVGAAKLLHAVPFSVETGFTHFYQAERPTVTDGWILVVEADTSLLRPRQTAEPVIYAGDQVAQKVNVGFTSGRVVLIVPSDRREDGTLKLDPKTLPVWFGTPALPEQVEARTIAAERQRADRAGITARPAEEVERAIDAGGDALELDGQYALMLEAMRLVKRYAPDESELADGWLIHEGTVQQGG